MCNTVSHFIMENEHIFKHNIDIRTQEIYVDAKRAVCYCTAMHMDKRSNGLPALISSVYLHLLLKQGSRSKCFYWRYVLLHTH